MDKVQKLLGDFKVSYGEELSLHTSMKVGGRAALYEPSSGAELAEVLRRSRGMKLPVYLLGGGTNTIFSDAGVTGVVVKFSKLNGITSLGNGGFLVGAGVQTAKFLAYCVGHGLGGCEFLSGIPGTIGGAFCMNAGSFDGEMKDIVAGVRLCRYNGEEVELSARDIEFQYRHTFFGGGAVTGVYVQLAKVEGVAAKVKSYLARRKVMQPVGCFTAGSIFKNPPDFPAGEIIDRLGLKGLCVGDAMVSKRHANFIVNRGNAASRDIWRLIRKVGKRVYEEAGVSLELEVHLVGRG